MFVVTVLFRIKPQRLDEFLPLMIENARASRADEEGCQQFDVCRDEDTVFLYEVYDDRAAFDVHLNTQHFLAFDAAVSDMVLEKQLRVYDEVIR